MEPHLPPRTRVLQRLRRVALLACLGGIGIVAAAATGNAQPAGRVHGAVVDEQNEAPVDRALIVLLPLDGNGSSLELETGSDGRFALSDVTPGLYAVTAARG